MALDSVDDVKCDGFGRLGCVKLICVIGNDVQFTNHGRRPKHRTVQQLQREVARDAIQNPI